MTDVTHHIEFPIIRNLEVWARDDPLDIVALTPMPAEDSEDNESLEDYRPVGFILRSEIVRIVFACTSQLSPWRYGGMTIYCIRD